MSAPLRRLPILVCAAIVRDGDRILIAQRNHDDKIEAGKWEFPGGKVEFGESPEIALAREIREELDLEIKVEKIEDVVTKIDPNGEWHIVLLFFWCRVIGGALRLIDAADAKWISIDELANYDFAKADIPVVEKLKKGLPSGW